MGPAGLALLIVALVGQHASAASSERSTNDDVVTSAVPKTPLLASSSSDASAFLDDRDWNFNEADDDKDVENELQSLHHVSATTETYDILEELADTDQERERPSEEDDEDGGGFGLGGAGDVMVRVTTLVPTALTEEDTRVDEPTEKGPAEPTRENGMTMVMDATSNPTEAKSTASPPPSSQPPARDRHFSATPAASSALAGKDSKDSEDSEEEQLEAIKRSRSHHVPPVDDDLIAMVPLMLVEDEGEKRRGQVERADDSSDEDDDDDDRNKTKNKPDTTTTTTTTTVNAEKQLAAAEGGASPSPHSNTTTAAAAEQEHFSRWTRRAKENGASSSSSSLSNRNNQPPAGGNPMDSSSLQTDEDLLELMVRLSEKKPRSWTRLSEMLGKLDYDGTSSSSQHKSTPQTSRKDKPSDGKHLKQVVTAARLGLHPASISPELLNSVAEKSSSNSYAKQPAHQQYSSPSQSAAAKGNNNNNKQSLKQLSTSRQGGNSRQQQQHTPPPANTIHVQWEKNRQQQKVAPTSYLYHGQRIAQTAGGHQGKQQQQPSPSWLVDGSRSGMMGTAAGMNKHQPYSTYHRQQLEQQQQQQQQQNYGAGSKDGYHRNNNKPGAASGGYPYTGPISTIAVDVPGSGMLNNRFPGEKNRQAYIAVSVYKPAKDNYRQIDLSPKMNNLPSSRYQESLRPKPNTNFAIEKPIAVVAPVGQELARAQGHLHQQQATGADISPGGGGGKTLQGHKTGKGGKGGKKQKNKTKNPHQQQKNKNHHARKLKQKNRLETDEIEAQLIALSSMEKKLQQHLMEKEKFRQRIRMKHHNVRPPREAEPFM